MQVVGKLVVGLVLLGGLLEMGSGQTCSSKAEPVLRELVVDGFSEPANKVGIQFNSYETQSPADCMLGVRVMEPVLQTGTSYTNECCPYGLIAYSTFSGSSLQLDSDGGPAPLTSTVFTYFLDGNFQPGFDPDPGISQPAVDFTVGGAAANLVFDIYRMDHWRDESISLMLCWPFAPCLASHFLSHCLLCYS